MRSRARLFWAFALAPLAPGLTLALLFIGYAEIIIARLGHAPISITVLTFNLFSGVFGYIVLTLLVTPWSMFLGYPALLLGIPAYFFLQTSNLTNLPAYLITGCLSGALYFEILNLSNAHGWLHYLFFNGYLRTKIALLMMLAGTISAFAFWLIARPDAR
jgi:hypothetical protein